MYVRRGGSTKTSFRGRGVGADLAAIVEGCTTSPWRAGNGRAAAKRSDPAKMPLPFAPVWLGYWRNHSPFLGTVQVWCRGCGEMPISGK